jgi:DNA-binding MarR family transcriptional regulator
MNQALQISNAILKLNRLYRKNVDHFLRDFKLTKPQLQVIGEIYMERKTIGQITDAIHLSYSTVSGVIDRLERDGWISRIRDASDRRVVWIQKEDKIDEIRTTIEFYSQRFFQDVLRGLQEEQLDTIVESLEILNTHLEKKAEEAFEPDHPISKNDSLRDQ